MKFNQRCPPGTGPTDSEAALLSITHPPGRPGPRCAPANHSQEAEALLPLPGAFH